MSTDKNTEFYRASHYGTRLEPGESLQVEHELYYKEQGGESLVPFTMLPIKRLQTLRDVSVAREKEIFDETLQYVAKWERQAANTMLIDKAIEYLETPAVEHTSNQWVKKDSQSMEISNMVYVMWFRTWEDTHYDSTLRKSVPHAWEVSWSIRTNHCEEQYRYGHKIAGQDRKKFTDKAKMEKYINGRFLVYAHLFTEISPPIPAEYKNDFTMNGLLLPGYTVQGEEPICVPLTTPTAKSIIVDKAPLLERKPKTEKAPAAKKRTGLAR